MGLSHEENLLDLTPHDLGKGCGSGRLFAVVFPRSRRASFSEFRRASSLKLVRPSATAREHSRSRIAFGEETLTSCLTRVGGPEIGWGWIAGRASARQFLPLNILPYRLYRASVSYRDSAVAIGPEAISPKKWSNGIGMFLANGSTGRRFDAVDKIGNRMARRNGNQEADVISLSGKIENPNLKSIQNAV